MQVKSQFENSTSAGACHPTMHPGLRLVAGLLLAMLGLAARSAGALDSARLPAYRCNPLGIFSSGFDPIWSAQPSGGFGGATGLVQRSVDVPGVGMRSYYLATPTEIAFADPEAALPLLIALHGAAGPGLADQAAQSTRSFWSGLAQAAGVIVVAPAASGSQGGWLPSIDFAQIDAVLADVLLAYPIDRARIYLWGFSAGGHVAHALTLLRDPQRYAAYAVNAGVLDAYAGAGAPAASERHVPLSIRVGSSDPLRSFALADRQRFLDADWTLDRDLRPVEFSGGHVLTSADPGAHWNFLCGFGLPPQD